MTTDDGIREAAELWRLQEEADEEGVTISKMPDGRARVYCVIRPPNPATDRETLLPHIIPEITGATRADALRAWDKWRKENDNAPNS